MPPTKPTSSHKTKDPKWRTTKRKQKTDFAPPDTPCLFWIQLILMALSDSFLDCIPRKFSKDPAPDLQEKLWLCPWEQPERIATPCSKAHWWHRSNLVHRCWARWLTYKHRHLEPEFELCNGPVVERARPGRRAVTFDDQRVYMSGALQVVPSFGDVAAHGHGGKTARLARSIPGIGSVFHKTRSRNTI
ncbi:MAG: hypothetical protein Q9167_001210 [Letrouitia subvulpina]